jgi:hypothetical protein
MTYRPDAGGTRKVEHKRWRGFLNPGVMDRSSGQTEQLAGIDHGKSRVKTNPPQRCLFINRGTVI